MGLFGNSNTTTTQTNAPWTGAQPYIKTGMKTAADLLKSKAGFKAPNFQTWSPMSVQTKDALKGTSAIARKGNPLAGQSMGAVSSILNGAENNKYNSLYNQAGSLGMGMDQKYNELYSQTDNPHFAQAVQNQADLIGNDVQRQFSGLGRTGSAADTGALVDQIGRMRTQALSDNWNQNIANSRGILGDQGQNRNAMIGNQQGILGQQVQGQLGAVAAAPGAYEQQYAPMQHLAQVGAAYDDLDARKRQAAVDKFNTNSMAPWNRLNAYNGAINGNAQGTGSTTQTVQPPSNWLGGALGGALGGGKLAGVPGAIGGGLLGLLSGL